MTSPQGHFVSLTKTLRRLANAGDMRGLEAYVRSDTWLVHFHGLLPARRHAALIATHQAYERCEAKHPLPKPGVAQKANWRDPAFRAKFCHLYGQGKTDAEVAVACQITLGAAVRARRRYVDAATPSFAVAA